MACRKKPRYRKRDVNLTLGKDFPVTDCLTNNKTKTVGVCSAKKREEKKEFYQKIYNHSQFFTRNGRCIGQPCNQSKDVSQTSRVHPNSTVS